VKHAPRRRFSQNFLVDSNYAGRIVQAIDPQPGDTVVEIGPGQGALTGRLVERAGRVVAIEIDRDLARDLRARFSADRLTLHEGDALEFDFGALGDDLRVVGNLPYHISSPLLFHLLDFAPRLRDVTVMLQREVVDRMTAKPATPDYGRLTVMLQSQFKISRLFNVPPGAFRPAPKVESAVVHLAPLAGMAPHVADRDLFAKVVKAAFGQRRKTLRNALSALADESALRRAGVDPSDRGETLPVADFALLANRLVACDTSRD